MQNQQSKNSTHLFCNGTEYFTLRLFEMKCINFLKRTVDKGCSSQHNAVMATFSHLRLGGDAKKAGKAGVGVSLMHLNLWCCIKPQGLKLIQNNKGKAWKTPKGEILLSLRDLFTICLIILQ